MGQKAHPYGLRLGIINDWKSKWFARKDSFPGLLIEDQKIKKFIKKKLSAGAISKITIARTGERIRIAIHTARPGVIIGRRGSEIESLREEVQLMVGEKQVLIDIKEVSKPAMEAQLIAENIALQLEKRIPFRRAMKRSMQMARDAGCEGMRIKLAGRLGGAEIARKESIRYGKIPLQTLRAEVDYGFAEAHTTYGLIGVKIWVYKGEKLGMDSPGEDKRNGIDAKTRQVPKSPKR